MPKPRRIIAQCPVPSPQKKLNKFLPILASEMEIDFFPCAISHEN